MKIGFAIGVVLLAVFLGFAYFHSKSIDRACLVTSVNDLLTARKQLQEHGSVTNAGLATRVYAFTNQVIVDETEYLAELATDVLGMTDDGRLVATADGTMVWIDNRSGATVVRSHDGRRFVIPPRFRDF